MNIIKVKLFKILLLYTGNVAHVKHILNHQVQAFMSSHSNW